jgi:hypothetical protein
MNAQYWRGKDALVSRRSRLRAGRECHECPTPVQSENLSRIGHRNTVTCVKKIVTSLEISILNKEF